MRTTTIEAASIETIRKHIDSMMKDQFIRAPNGIKSLSYGHFEIEIETLNHTDAGSGLLLIPIHMKDGRHHGSGQEFYRNTKEPSQDNGGGECRNTEAAGSEDPGTEGIGGSGGEDGSQPQSDGKRRRGRPKGSKNKTHSDTGRSSRDEGTKEGGRCGPGRTKFIGRHCDVPGDQSGIKRGRGRPKGSRNKRGPGRPKGSKNKQIVG